MVGVVADEVRIDLTEAVAEITEALRRQIGQELLRGGAVVALSGGVDSAVCAAVAVRALGPDRVLGLALPEQESDPRSLELAREYARHLGIPFVVEEITPILEAAGCYSRRDAAVRRVAPFARGWPFKLAVDVGQDGGSRLPICHLVLRAPAGEEHRLRLPAREYREIVAATNLKQRVRAMATYHHADRLHYAVIGTPNRLEYELGFFVKGGDGLADVKPIAHLFKGQVYRLAEFLGVPEEIRRRTPTTDTYALPQTQEEFYFAVPLRVLDLLLAARASGGALAGAAAAAGIDPDRAERILAEVDRKKDAARYLHEPPLRNPDPDGMGPIPFAEVY